MREQEAELRVEEAEMQKQMDLFMKVVVKELIRDKLISDIEDYEFQFKNKKLYINGEKQPDAVFKKYKKLYEKATGKKLDDNRNFRIVNRK
jgi:hypothetical protein